MDDSIRIRSGELGGRAEMPSLKYAEVKDGKKLGSELGYRTDTKELYIGTSAGNVRLCGEEDARKIETHDTNIAELTAKIEEITARLDSIAPVE